MKKKILSLVAACSIFLTSTAFATSFNKSNDDIIYGVALNDQQRKIVDNAIGVDLEEYNVGTVNGADLKKYLGYGTADSNMISSVTVKRLPKGSGIKVNIKTPGNISQITEAQYTNAAITAGITDAEINVASPKPVTGESALVGVYKSEEYHGQEIDVERTKTAQEELSTVIEVAKENEGKNGFDSKDLDKAVIEVKQRLADYKEKNGETASNDQIAIFIKDALNNVNMGDILSNNNINLLVNYFNNYQSTSAIDSKEVRDNLLKLGKDLGSKASKFYTDNKDTIDKFAKDNKENIEKIAKDAKDSGLLDKIIAFIRDIINSIMGGDSQDQSNN